MENILIKVGIEPKSEFEIFVDICISHSHVEGYFMTELLETFVFFLPFHHSDNERNHGEMPIEREECIALIGEIMEILQTYLGILEDFFPISVSKRVLKV